MQSLPKELTGLVSWSVAILGQAIKTAYGEECFQRIENLRTEMKSLRQQEDSQKEYNILLQSNQEIEKLTNHELSQIAHSYLLMLETMNRCENAYRIYRIKIRSEKRYEDIPDTISYAFTAHPTEARSKEFMEIFLKIQNTLGQAIGNQNEFYKKKLFHFFLIALKVKADPGQKPTVLDEAQNIYRYALDPTIIYETLYLRYQGINLKFRSWVGGDKDGHPGVNEKIFKESLNGSRAHLIEFINQNLNEAKRILKYIDDKKRYLSFRRKIYTLKLNCKLLKNIRKNDYKGIEKFKEKIEYLSAEVKEYLGGKSLELEVIEGLFGLYPALVLPIEMREDSADIREALTTPTKFAIGKMLIELKKIAPADKLKYYVRGFIISMTETPQDLKNGIKLLKKTLGSQCLPVIPLFENYKGLTEAPVILKEGLDNATLNLHKNKWRGKFEVMLGYSDSSKENGVFPSRLLISQAMRVIDKTLSDLDLVTIFFHGSGGSVERGGGSIKEQTSYWPKNALNHYKVTVQGEMVARILS